MATPPHRPTVIDRRRRGATFDAGLVERTRCGDRAAFAELYQLTLDAVTRYVAVRMRDRDRDAVGDLVHDAYCFALAEPTLIGDDPIGSMLRLAARAVTRHGWSNRRYIRAAYTVGEDQQTNPVPDLIGSTTPTVSEAVTRMTFVHALARLTPGQRQAIQLRHIDGYPRDATAKAMGRTVNAVRHLERAALRRLHHQFTPAAEAPVPVAERQTAQAGATAAR
ncbi:sigma-70 family RNA polymerase sigma factor [Micromonospora sp. WMMD1082]|uniref:RNA polymerase sigma factor n=1 Tax=Micromonospora sp. WMMD1082 TaxID=3016104 RepID=UPI002417E5EB|nr:sigma-70 family RNA polymerase sigma factor [Micromonospora sp. WMMD1082]MDG4793639.1 sigma-70 family RNA polymerase sigma factor [Micromonospora sp. WMMD1082]